jgi:hypothetical protein
MCSALPESLAEAGSFLDPLPAQAGGGWAHPKRLAQAGSFPDPLPAQAGGGWAHPKRLAQAGSFPTLCLPKPAAAGLQWIELQKEVPFLVKIVV